MAALLALAAALLASPARAAEGAIVGYDAFPAPGEPSFFSADGYHLASLETTKDEDFWKVDGKTRARGPKGTLSAGPAALSPDGSVLFHCVGAVEGLRPAVNGVAYGAVWKEILSPVVSARGRNAAFIGHSEAGYAVVSGQGTGPAFPTAPEALAVGEDWVSYEARWQGRRWLYRDHKPVSALPEPKKTPYGLLIEVDGRTYGPYPSVSGIATSPNGRHWAFQPQYGRGSKGGYVVDGVERPGHKCDCSLVVDDQGRVFQDEVLIPIPKGEMHDIWKDGKELYPHGRPPKVATSPDGAHFVYPMMTPLGGSIGMDGALLRKHAPIPLSWSPLVFDGPSDFHYWSVVGSRFHLICANTDGSDVALGPCAQRGVKNGWTVVP